jgi:hypothetical protein
MASFVFWFQYNDTNWYFKQWDIKNITFLFQMHQAQGSIVVM